MEKVLNLELNNVDLKMNFENTFENIVVLQNKTQMYFPQNTYLDNTLSALKKDLKEKDLNELLVKKIEDNWKNALQELKNEGCSEPQKDTNLSIDLKSPQEDIQKTINKTNDSVLMLVENVKLRLQPENKKEKNLDDEDIKEKTLEDKFLEIQKSVENGLSPQAAAAQMNLAVIEENSKMKNMPKIGTPSFNPLSRIEATLTNKNNLKTAELYGDILEQKNESIAQKCMSGYYTPDVLNAMGGQLLWVAIKTNPNSIDTLVNGGANISGINSELITNEFAKQEVERLQFEKEHPVKSALGMRH